MTAEEWTFEFVSLCQRFICEADNVSLKDVTSLSTAFIGSIPTPPSMPAGAMLRSTLFELAIRWAQHGHRALAPQCHKACVTMLNETDRYWAVVNRSPQEAFLNWMTDCCAELAHAHPAPLATRVAVLIEARLQSGLQMSVLAKEVGAHPASIRREFRRQFKMSLREYQTQARVRRAAQLLSDGSAKVEPVALAVGWRSKKNLYRAFRRVTGQTPASFKARGR